MDFNKKELIKSPLNYTGNKYKLLPQLLPLFPNEIDTFVDLFAGGCSVGVNVKANKIICNDINYYIITILEGIYLSSNSEILENINYIIDKYKLSKINRQGFERLREEWNNNNIFIQPPYSWIPLYVLICYSFNYQIRFNNKYKYNSSFGINRSCFSKQLQDRLINFSDNVAYKYIEFSSKDFLDISVNKFSTNDLIYCDPPYLITTGSYNDGNRGFKNWDENKEKDLLKMLDNLNSRKIKFALSNVLENKGKSNDILKKWCKKYNVHYLNNTYSNCSYHTKDKSKNSTIEVLITNY